MAEFLNPRSPVGSFILVADRLELPIPINKLGIRAAFDGEGGDEIGLG